MIIERFALERDDRLIDDPPGAHIVKYGARREAPVWLTWLCQCGSWTMDGAYLVGRCNVCGAERPVL